MSKNLGQTAVEYITTYGWAILVLLVAVAALFWLGVFNPQVSVSSTCILPSDFNCRAFLLSTNGSLTLDVGQATGKAIRVTALRCTQEAAPVFDSSDALASPILISNGDHEMITNWTKSCYELNASGEPVQASGNPGSLYKGRIFIEYEDVVSGFKHRIMGEVAFKYEGEAPERTPTPGPSITPPTEVCGTCQYCDTGSCGTCPIGHCIPNTCNAASTCGTACDHCDGLGTCCSGGLPYCSSNTCVECLVDGDCPVGIPYCLNGDCVAESTCAVSGETEIEDCQTISSMGNYVLCTDLSSSTGYCVEFTAGASGSTLDCKGHRISALTWTVAVYLDSVSNMEIRNCNFVGSGAGIVLHSSSDNNITDSNFTSNLDGIQLSSSSGNRIMDNNFTSNTDRGIYLDLSSPSNDNNIISGNTASLNGEGLRINSGTGNTVSGNTFNENTNNGGMIISSSGNIFLNNNASLNSNYGFYSTSVVSNTFSGNTFCSNGVHDLYCNPVTTNTGASIYDDDTGCNGIGKTNSCSGAPFVIADSLSWPYGIAIDSTHVYVTDQDAGNLVKIPIGGGSKENIATGQSQPWDIAVDGTNVYWGDYSDEVIRNMSKNGGAITTLATAYSPMEIDIDSDNVYWTDYYAGFVDTVSKSGGSKVNLADVDWAGPWAIAVRNGYVYWTESDDGRIARIPVGSGSIEPIATGLEEPYGIAVDDTHVYWADDNAGKVQRAPIGGGAVETLASGLTWPSRLAVDDTNVYFTEYSSSGTIKMVSKIPGGTVETIATSQRYPEYIILDDQNIYWTEGGNGRVWQMVRP